MAKLEMRWTGAGHNRIASALAAIDDKRGRTALRLAVNHTGAKAFTGVKRALARQVGLPQYKIVAKGGLRTVKATYESLDFQIRSRGRFLSLKDFGARQLKRGVRAKVWGRWQLFPTTFMGPRPGVIAAALGGHVFDRVSRKRLPIRRLWGPAIPREMVRDQSAEEFERVVSSSLPDRVAHEIRRLTKGVAS